MCNINRTIKWTFVCYIFLKYSNEDLLITVPIPTGLSEREGRHESSVPPTIHAGASGKRSKHTNRRTHAQYNIHVYAYIL